MDLEIVPAVAREHECRRLHCGLRCRPRSRQNASHDRACIHVENPARRGEAKNTGFPRKNKVKNSLYAYMHATVYTQTIRPVAPAFLRSIANVRTCGHTPNHPSHGARTHLRFVPAPITRPRPVLPPRFERPFANTPHAPLNCQIEPPCGPVAGPRNHCRPIMPPQDSGVD